MNKTDISGISENPHLYGTFHNVVLKDLELKELKRRFPYDWQDWIEKLSAYMKSTGKYYRKKRIDISDGAFHNENSSLMQLTRAESDMKKKNSYRWLIWIFSTFITSFTDTT